MNADQKKRIAHEISNWKNACNCRAVQLAGDRMAALLQELIDAPEVLPATNPSQISSSAEPFGYFKAEPFGWTDCAETDDGAIALYTAPPVSDVEPVAYVTGVYGGHTTVAPIDAAQVLRVGMALYTAPPEPPADVARDAEPFAVIHLDGSFVHVEFKQDIAGTGKFEVYAAPPAPSVPDGWRPFLTDVITAAGLLEHGKRDKGLAGRIGKFAFAAMRAAPTPAEPTADVVRDAERLRQFEKWADAGYAPCLAYDDDGHWQISFDGFNAVGEPLGRVTIFTEKDDWHDSVGEAIDAAIGRQGGE